MFARINTAAAGLIALAGLLTACSDSATAPAAARQPSSIASFSGRTVDTSTVQVGTGGGQNQGGGSSSSGVCGTLTNISSYQITVYTTRTGIGITGMANNCGTKNAAFEVAAVDINPDPACVVDMPHFIAPKNTNAGLSTFWQVSSTLIYCPNTWHTFNLTLTDSRSAAVLATSQISVFM